MNGLLRDHLTEKQKAALKNWKLRVKSWHPMEADLFRYLRNQTPSKACVVLVDWVPRSEVQVVNKALRDYWMKLESWENLGDPERASEVAEDKYAAFCDLCAI